MTLTKKERRTKFKAEHPEFFRLTKAQQRYAEKNEKARVVREARAIRLEGIVAMRLENKTLEEIGQKYNVSRERIRQLLAKHVPDLKGPVKRIEYIDGTCAQCGREIRRRADAKGKRFFCNRECMFFWRAENKPSRAEALARRREYQRKRYTSPEKRARHRVLTHAYYLRIKNTPDYKKKQRGYAKKWRAKKMATDPAWAERERAKHREYYHRKMADPERRAKIQAYYREYEKKRGSRHRVSPFSNQGFDDSNVTPENLDRIRDEFV